MDFLYDISQLPLETVSSGIRRFVFTLDHIMGVYFEIEPGIVFAEHSHPNEQMGILIKGTVKWKIRGKEMITKGPVLYRIPYQEPHSAEIIGDEPALFLDIFYPHRKEFLKEGPEEYMKGR